MKQLQCVLHVIRARGTRSWECVWHHGSKGCCRHCTHIQTAGHATRTHTYRHAHVCTRRHCKQIQTAHAHFCPRSHACMHLQTLVHSRTCTHAHLCTNTNTLMLAHTVHTHAQTHTYTYACTHMCSNTHMHTRSRTLRSKQMCAHLAVIRIGIIFAAVLRAAAAWWGARHRGAAAPVAAPRPPHKSARYTQAAPHATAVRIVPGGGRIWALQAHCVA